MKKLITILSLLILCGNQSCNSNATPKSTSGVTKTVASVKTGTDGLTVEQRNVKKRLLKDNIPGSVKHLYVVSAYSGDVIIYSTVKGKVTSSGKRLSPTSVASGEHSWGIPIQIGDRKLRTTEVLQDDGTYGSSIPYVYWFDQRDVYHQHYVSGGQILHVSDKPLTVGKIILNMELTPTQR